MSVSVCLFFLTMLVLHTCMYFNCTYNRNSSVLLLCECCLVYLTEEEQKEEGTEDKGEDEEMGDAGRSEETKTPRLSLCV